MTVALSRDAGGGLLSRALSGGVPSALQGLTAVFGMGTGVAPALQSPAMLGLPRRSRGDQTSKNNERGSDRDANQASISCRSKVLCGEGPHCVLHTADPPDRSSQAARAIRTAALGVGCPTSTGGLLTGWSPPALQEARSLGSVHLGACFPLRCVQRLSQPFIATRRCPWQDSRDTSGMSDPVLSY